MSYDLMVFEKDAVPRNRKEFMEWFQIQTSWNEDHDYNDLSLTSESLKNWFLEMINTFPAMNGPYADDDLDNENVTGYSIDKESIYMDFRWSVAEKAYQMVTTLARKHNLGFFDVSGDEGDIIIPDNGIFVFIDKQNFELKDVSYAIVTTTRKRPWWKFWIKKTYNRTKKMV